jgi:UDP-N-acetylmuramoylalanine--D-glutamate ligase
MSTNKKIVILGAGESGVGAALLAKHVGFEVFVSDQGAIKDFYKEKLNQSKIDFEENGHTESKILEATEIIKSPGIPDKAEIIQKAKKNKIKIIGEIEFAARFTNAKKIAITGTNGKTTTTLLTYHLLKKAGLDVRLAGNVGNSFAEQVLEELKGDASTLLYVLEISSFMLDNMYDFKADVGILTNITPDHLDRYDYKIDKYVDSKFRIIQNMDKDSVFIYGIDSELIEDRLIEIDTPAIELPFSLYPDEFDGACGVENESILIQFNEKETEIDISKAVLKGKHNLYNMMAASLAAISVGVSKETIENGLQDFVNHPHRLEDVGYINGVRFINDSKATNIDSAWYALDAMTQPIVWIAGGVDKGNNYKDLDDVVKGKVKALICLGKDNDKLKSFYKKYGFPIEEAQSMAECIEKSILNAVEGDVVLLSPCCASFDLFKNYEDRGNQFRELVKKFI